MAKTLQFRRDTTANLASVTGAEGEIFIDLTKDTVVVMDGSTAGGKPLATESYVGTAISNLIDSAPGTLDTLNELAAALGDDANFATSISNTVATAGSYANSASSYANSAYNQANTGTVLAQAAFDAANTGGGTGNYTFSGNNISLITDSSANLIMQTSNTTLSLIANSNTSTLGLEFAIVPGQPVFSANSRYDDVITVGLLGSNAIALANTDLGTGRTKRAILSTNSLYIANVATTFTGNPVIEDAITITTDYSFISKSHGGLSGSVNTYGGQNQDMTYRGYANTSNDVQTMASATGNQILGNFGYFGGLANGEVGIVETTIIAQSHNTTAGSNAFDGTKVWKYETIITNTQTTLDVQNTSVQISNTGNSASWDANLYLGVGLGGLRIDVAVTGESGKNIFWYATVSKKSLWCSFAPAPGGGGGGK
jgi:hypothetical protein